MLSTVIIVFISRGICSNEDDDPVRDQLENYFEPLAKAYRMIMAEQAKLQRQFFGLRDFYR